MMAYKISKAEAILHLVLVRMSVGMLEVSFYFRHNDC